MSRKNGIALIISIVLCLTAGIKLYSNVKPTIFYNSKQLIVEEEAMMVSLYSAETYIETTVCSYEGLGYTKSYMEGKLITNASSKQYDLMWESGLISLNPYGHYVYYENGREYLGVAMSTVYGEVGDKFRITLSNGSQFYVIKLDSKADSEVDSCGSHPDGSVIEFVVDTQLIYANYPNFNGGFQVYDMFNGYITNIEKEV